MFHALACPLVILDLSISSPSSYPDGYFIIVLFKCWLYPNTLRPCWDSCKHRKTLLTFHFWSLVFVQNVWQLPCKQFNKNRHVRLEEFCSIFNFPLAKWMTKLHDFLLLYLHGSYCLIGHSFFSWTDSQSLEVVNQALISGALPSTPCRLHFVTYNFGGQQCYEYELSFR